MGRNIKVLVFLTNNRKKDLFSQINSNYPIQYYYSGHMV